MDNVKMAYQKCQTFVSTTAEFETVVILGKQENKYVILESAGKTDKCPFRISEKLNSELETFLRNENYSKSEDYPDKVFIDFLFKRYISPSSIIKEVMVESNSSKRGKQNGNV
jgi:hypothetical protein